MVWFRAFILMCSCVTLEIAFNGVRRLLRHRKGDFLAYISVWMLPIYFFGIGFALPLLHGLIVTWPWAFRTLTLAVSIMAFEFVAATVFGWFGIKPWEYTRGVHIQGKVRVDYVFYWWAFGAAFDVYHTLLVRLLP